LLVAHLYGYGAHIEFIQYTAGEKMTKRVDPNMPCAAHVCFDVADISKTWEKLLAAGAEPQGEIALVDNGPVKGLRAVYLRDPSGILLELVESPL
jgi:catechol 2,3-dioxygenase-like lactoylglutathione lyase family enzyme